MTHVIEHADALTYLRGNRWLVQNGFIPKAHAIFCDPPYALPGGFMSKDWDNFKTPQAFQSWVSEWAGLLIDYVYPGAVGLFFGGTRTYHRLAAGIEEAGWEIADCLLFAWTHGQGFPKSTNIERVTSDPRWRGYGSHLKPAWEPIVIARAPRGKRTYAALAREFGTGALNVDGSRIGTSVDDPNVRVNTSIDRNGGVWGNGAQTHRAPTLQQGRWPANFGLVCACEGDDHADDCPVSVLGRQSGETTSTANPRNNSEFKSVAKGYEYAHVTHGHDDAGTSARFFYQAKAAAWEREAGLHGFAKRPMREPGAEFGKMTMWNGENGDEAWRAKNPNTPRANVHPTVKPIRLAEYLARLILPPELDTPRRLLVPFAGSGSEMIGARLAGWDVVTGIEREAEYVELAQARVGWWAQFGTYDEARAAYEKERKAKPAPAPIMVEDEKPAQLALFDGGAA